jgi:hypothetical protein
MAKDKFGKEVKIGDYVLHVHPWLYSGSGVEFLVSKVLKVHEKRIGIDQLSHRFVPSTRTPPHAFKKSYAVIENFVLLDPALGSELYDKTEIDRYVNSN